MRELATATQNTPQLRPYQQQLAADIYQAWGSYRSVLAQLPTGGGKTHIFTAIALEFLQRGESVLAIAHRRELIEQAATKLEAATGRRSGILKAGYCPDPTNPLQVGSVQTLDRRKHRPAAGLVIVDEAHHAAARSYRELLACYPEAYILGVTATPCRTDGQGLHRAFDALVQGPSVRELIDAGHLCDFRLFAAAAQVDTSGIQKRAGDYKQGALAKAAADITGAIVPTWRQYAQDRLTVFFCVNVAHSRQVCQAFQAEGIPAEHLDGSYPASERAAILERFRQRQTLVLTNCGIVSEGFDVPGIEAVQIVRPTASPVVHLQQLGRGLRPEPGKDRLTIIDHTKNWAIHGLVDDEREWTLSPEPLGADAPQAQRCPDCGHVFRPLPHEKKPARKEGTALIGHCHCPACGQRVEFELEPQRERTGDPSQPPELIQDEAGQLIEVDNRVYQRHQQIFEHLKVRQELLGRQLGWVQFRLLERPEAPNFTLADWKAFARKLGYKRGWGYHKYREVQGL